MPSRYKTKSNLRCEVTGGWLWGGSLCFLPPLDFSLLLSLHQGKESKVKHILRADWPALFKAMYNKAFNTQRFAYLHQRISSIAYA